ncbi:hypothetical protein ACFY00_21785 [Kitasatospora sp. NPDC001540]|uniref:hypothetical protein n=1 Tax=Kitasatospora sp. NPDC001540 TaxID=3364014 RepID=UPI0036B5D86B
MPIRRPAFLQRLRRRPHRQAPHVSPVDFPCLLIDDDGLMLPCADDDELQQLTEPDFTDEITAAFDASARPLQVHLVGERRAIALRPVGEPDPDALVAHVTAYFHHWTDRTAPIPAEPTHICVTHVATVVRDTPTRRRRP